MTDKTWNLTLTTEDGLQSVTLDKVVPETRPSLNIEEEAREEDGKTIWYPKRDEQGKILSSWSPMIFSNVPAPPLLPNGTLNAAMEFQVGTDVMERWTFQNVRAQFIKGGYLRIEFDGCQFQQKGLNL